MILNMVGGAGGGEAMSSIIVTALTGSTVYIENQEGKRKDTGEKDGVWTFKNCDIGTWTVYASKGDQSATATVEITEEGQLMRYYVDIEYDVFLYKKGNEYSSLTGGWNQEAGWSGWGSGTVSKNSENLLFSCSGNGDVMINFGTVNQIDMSKYKTAYVVLESYDPIDADSYFSFYIADASVTQRIAVTSKTTISVDITNINGNYAAKFQMIKRSNGTSNAVVSEVGLI